MFSIFDMVLQSIKEWTPKGQYSTEAKYRDDLLRYLRERFKPSESVGSYILGLGSSEQHTIKKEAGRHRIDIAIDNKIGIELKLNLKHQKDSDRLVGQIERFLDEYSHLIIVLCGYVEQEKIDDLKHSLGNLVGQFSSPFGQEKTIRIVSKDKSQTFRREKNPFVQF